MKKHLVPALVTVIVTLLTFTTVAHAAGAVEPAHGSLLTPVFDAFAHGNYLYAASLMLVALVALARRWGVTKWAWLATDAGGAAMVLVGSFGATMATHFADGNTPFTFASVWIAIRIAVGAAGGYTMIKHLFIAPYLQKLATKGPRWIHAPATLILWVFQEQMPEVPTSGNTSAPPSAQ